MEEFRNLHIQVSGRETRSITTWEKQFKMVLENEAFLALGCLDKKLVAELVFF